MRVLTKPMFKLVLIEGILVNEYATAIRIGTCFSISNGIAIVLFRKKGAKILPFLS